VHYVINFFYVKSNALQVTSIT